MGVIAHGQNVVGDSPKLPHRNFMSMFLKHQFLHVGVLSLLYTAKMYSKNYECVIMHVTKRVLISA